jgi:hypothetical protein
VTGGSTNTIVSIITDDLAFDPYLTDVLMRDLVGDDRRPSAFLVYLWLWRMSRGDRRRRAAASLQMIATRTGLSKSAVQAAIRHLVRRHLVMATRSGPTAAPIYQVHTPWRSDGA